MNNLNHAYYTQLYQQQQQSLLASQQASAGGLMSATGLHPPTGGLTQADLVNQFRAHQIPPSSLPSAIRGRLPGHQGVRPPTMQSATTKVAYIYEDPAVQENVTVTHVVSPAQFSVQLKRRLDDIATMRDSLQEVYAAMTPERDPRFELGAPCVARYFGDQMWYRGIIIEIRDANQVDVIFVDYGNKETVEISDVRNIHPQFTTLPIMAFTCRIYGAQPQGSIWSTDETNLFQSLIQHPLSARFIGADGVKSQRVYQILLSRTDTGSVVNTLFSNVAGPYAGLSPSIAKEADLEISANLRELSNGQSSSSVNTYWTQTQPIVSTRPPPGFSPLSAPRSSSASPTGEPPVRCFKTLMLPMEKVIRCRLCSLKSPSDFYVHANQSRSNFAQMVKAMQSTYSADHPLPMPEPVTVGMPCAVLWSITGQWCRAYIRRVMAHGQFEVYLIDFGNNEVVSSHCVQNMHPQFTDLPMQAVHIALSGFSVQTAWSQPACDDFKKRISNCKNLLVEPLKFDGDSLHMCRVHVMVDESSPALNMNFYMARYQQEPSPGDGPKVPVAVVVPKKEPVRSPFQEPSPPLKVPLNVLVSFVKNAWDFYIQPFPAEYDVLCARMLERYANCDRKHLMITNFVRNTACCVYHHGDGVWYRALVLKPPEMDGHVELQYIDYGNTDKVKQSDILQLQHDLCSVPKMAVNCAISGVEPTGGKWSPESTGYFESALGDFNSCILLSESRGKYKVQLFSQSTPSEDIRLGLTARKFAVAAVELDLVSLSSPHSSLRFPEPNIAKLQGTLNVFVSHVSSPTEFWVQVYTEDDLISTVISYVHGATQKPATLQRLTTDTVGAPCLALFRTDNTWYRARITGPAPSGYKVHFIDFGNDEAVHAENVKRLPEELLKYAPQAICCCLEPGVPVTSEELKAKILEEDLEMEVVERLDGKICVRLFRNKALMFSPGKAARAKAADFFGATENHVNTSPPKKSPRQAVEQRTHYNTERAPPQRSEGIFPQKKDSPPQKFFGRTFEATRPQGQEQRAASFEGRGERRDFGQRQETRGYQRRDENRLDDGRRFQRRDDGRFGSERREDTQQTRDTGFGGGQQRSFGSRMDAFQGRAVAEVKPAGDRDDGEQKPRFGQKSGGFGGGTGGSFGSGGGTGGRTCYKCGKDGHMSRECPEAGPAQSGGGFGGGQRPDSRTCFKCGKEGHMSRDCPEAGSAQSGGGFGSGGGTGGRTCYKCGKEGHMSRECPEAGSAQSGGGFGSGGGTGGRTCYKCGKEGHMSRECPEAGPSQSGGGFSGGQRSDSRTCFKCGKEGHMSRDCPEAGSAQSGGGFGGGQRSDSRACFKCGKEGHMSRDCPEAGSAHSGGGFGGGQRSDSRACFKCGKEGHLSRDCPEASGGQGGGRGCFKCGKEGHMARDCTETGTGDQQRPRDGNRSGSGGFGGDRGGGFGKRDSGTGGFGGPSAVAEENWGGDSAPIAIVGKPLKDLGFISLPAGSTHKACLSYGESPRRFFVQLANDETKIVTVSKKINSSASIAGAVDKPEKGYVYAVKFPEDNLWYRGEVLSVNGDKAIVRIVDYGDRFETNVRALKFTDIDDNRYAVPCVMTNCPRDVSKEQLDTFQKLTTGPNTTLQVKFLNSSVPYEVDFVANDGSLASEVLFGAPHVPEFFEYAPHDKLAVGEYQCFVAEIASASSIFLHPREEEDTLNKITTMLAENYPMTELLDPELNMACVAKFYDDDNFYRATVQTIDDDGVTVRFIDYGNTSIVRKPDIFPVADSLKLPAHAVPCYLLGIPFEKANDDNFLDKLSELLIDSPVTVSVKSTAIPYAVSMTVNDEDVIEKLIHSSLPQPCVVDVSTPDLSKEVGCFVSHCNSFEDFYIQYDADTDALDVLAETMEDHYPTGCEVSDDTKIESVLLNQPVCASYSDDGVFYRGIVQSVLEDGDKFNVFFFDYGNTEQVCKDSVRKMPVALATPKRLAHSCRLSSKPSTDFNKFIADNGDKQFKVKFITQTPPYTVQLADNTGPLFQSASPEAAPPRRHPMLDAVSALIDAQPKPKRQERDLPQKVTPPVGHEERRSSVRGPTSVDIRQGQTAVVLKEARLKFVTRDIPRGTHNGYISHVESLDQVFVQLAEEETKLDVFMSQVNARKFQSFPVDDCEVGDACAAKFVDDEQVYRAQIVELDGSTARVRFVDYGNCQTCQLDTLLRIPRDLLSTPPFAIEAFLPVADDVDCEVDILMESCADQVLPISFESSGRPCRITTEIEGLALSFKEKTLQPFATPSSITVGFVSFVRSLSEFYIQLSSRQDDLNRMQINLGEAYPLKEDQRKKLKIGMPCCTLYAEDNSWYRAQIVGESDTSLKVFFVDYGNTESTDRSNVYPLLDQFFDETVFAGRCALPIDVSKSTPDHLDEFQELVLISEVTVEPLLVGAETCFIDVSIDDVSVLPTLKLEQLSTEELQKLTKMRKLRFLPPLTGVADGTVVSYRSLEHFYVESGGNDTLAIDNPSPLEADFEDAVICVQVKDKFERAYILERSEASLVVFFVDLGLIDEVDYSSAFELPLQCLREPVRTHRCCFSSVAGVNEKEIFDSQNTLPFEFLGAVNGFHIVNIDESGASDFQSDLRPRILQQSLYPLPKWDSDTTVTVTEFESLTNFWLRPTEFAEFGSKLEEMTRALQFPDTEMLYEQAACDLVEEVVSESVDEVLKSNEQEAVDMVQELVLESSIALETVVSRMGDVDLDVSGIETVEAAIDLIEGEMNESHPEANKISTDKHLLDASLILDDIIGKLNELDLERTTDEACERAETSITEEIREIFNADDSCERGETSILESRKVIEENVLESAIALENVVSKLTGLDPESSGLEVIQQTIDVIESEAVMKAANQLQAQEVKRIPQIPYNLIGATSKIVARVDGLWHRAVIVDAIDFDFLVRLIDYGKMATVKLSDLHVAPDEVADIPAYAMPCKLAAPVEEDHYKEIAERITELLSSDEELLVRVLKDDELPAEICLLNSDGDDIVTKMAIEFVVGQVLEESIESVEKDLHRQSEEQRILCEKQAEEERKKQARRAEENRIKAAATLKVKPMHLTEKTYQVYVADVVNPNHFLCSLADDTILQELSDAINEFYESSGTPVQAVEYGMHLVARFTDDGLWYRAEVTAVDEQSISVFFLDYGNKDRVKMAELRYLEPQFVELFAQVVTCSISGWCPKNEENVWAEEESDAFWDKVQEKELTLTVEGDSTDKNDLLVYLVQVFEDDVNVANTMVKEGYGQLDLPGVEETDTTDVEEKAEEEKMEKVEGDTSEVGVTPEVDDVIRDVITQVVEDAVSEAEASLFATVEVVDIYEDAEDDLAVERGEEVIIVKESIANITVESDDLFEEAKDV